MSTVLLKCARGKTGINAFVEVDGVAQPGLAIQNGTRWDVSKLRKRAIAELGPVKVDLSCSPFCPQFMYRTQGKLTIWKLLYVILEFFSYL